MYPDAFDQKHLRIEETDYLFVIGGAGPPLMLLHAFPRPTVLDAFVPVSGRSMFDLMPASMRASLQAAAQSSGGGWQMPPIPLERLGPLGAIGTGVDISHLPELLARRGPHPIGTYEEPAGPRNPRALQVPTVYITCGTHGDDDPMAPVVAAVRVAGIPIYVLPTGHFPMLTMPVELADLLESLLPV